MLTLSSTKEDHVTIRYVQILFDHLDLMLRQELRYRTSHLTILEDQIRKSFGSDRFCLIGHRIDLFSRHHFTSELNCLDDSSLCDRIGKDTKLTIDKMTTYIDKRHTKPQIWFVGTILLDRFLVGESQKVYADLLVWD